MIGFVALLDRRPRIEGKPTAKKGPAQFQQLQGTTANPFAHAIPSNMLLNGDSLVSLHRSPETRSALERVFGMGLMAPGDWETKGAFSHQPRQSNIVDAIAKRHRYGGGLAEAFQSYGEAAVAKGRVGRHGQATARSELLERKRVGTASQIGLHSGTLPFCTSTCG